MNPIQVRIDWGAAIETIQILDASPKQIRTQELWEKRYWVTYVAHVERFSPSTKTRTLVLRYSKKDQKDPRIVEQAKDIAWGHAEITWQAGGVSAKVRWVDVDPNSDDNCTITKIKVSESPDSPAIRAAILVEIKKRRQQALKRELLTQDGSQCVLTKEKQPETLQAAHIFPVASDKFENDTIFNAMLLRADVHLLFDARLFGFVVENGKATVKCSKHLEQKYVKLLSGVRLPERTYARIAQSLAKRTKKFGSQIIL